jgi:hypothetical protein
MQRGKERERNPIEGVKSSLIAVRSFLRLRLDLLLLPLSSALLYFQWRMN